MNTKKLRFTTLFVALAMLIISLAGIVFVRVAAISAEATYRPSALFATSSRSEVETTDNRIMFTFGGTSSANNAVNYNRNLAYKWFSADEDAASPTENYFSLEFSFRSATFDTFTITFQSAENSKSTDGVTENQIVFLKEGENYAVAIRSDDEADVADEDLTVKEYLSSLNGVTVSFAEGSNSGEYAVTVKVGDDELKGTFTNVRGAYAQYTASKLVPLSFAAELPAEDTEETAIFIDSLNGQSFALNDDGQVVDDTPPVLVINDDIRTFALGTTLLDNFSYATVDVCDATVTRTTTYYQYAEEDSEENYLSLTSSVRIFDTDLYETEGYELVSVRFVLNDDDNNEAEYFVSWYAEDRTNNVVTKGDTEYLKVTRNANGPAYTCITGANTPSQTFEETAAYTAYVADVAAAAEELRAGDGYYFYLPSLEDLIEDDDTAYTGLNFTVYYKAPDSQSASTRANLSYDDLEIPVNAAGKYIFKVIATDKQGNAMKFYDENGNLVAVDSQTVWDIDVIPSFSFYAENMGLEVEKTEELTYAYVYSNYTIEDIEVKGLSGYESRYSLYYLDGVSSNSIDYASMISFANECYQDGVSVKDFVEQLSASSGQTLSDASLRKINEWAENGPEDEDDDGWETHDNRYAWRASSRSFTPQESGYYVMYVELVDSGLAGRHVYAYQIVYASSEVDQVYGETYWIEDNVVTVVFIVIAVISAIALLVVWITFPADDKTGKLKKAAEGGKFADKRKSSSDENSKK